MGIGSSEEYEQPEFLQGEMNAFVAAGESKHKDSIGRIKDCLSRGLAIDIRADDDDGLQFTCLLRACRADRDGCCEKVQYLLERGANPNVVLTKKGGGVTAAHLAVMNNSKKVLKLLLDNGYDPKLRDSLRNETALECAIRKGKTPNYNPVINDNNGISDEIVNILAAHGDQIIKIEKQKDDDDWFGDNSTRPSTYGGDTRPSTTL